MLTYRLGVLKGDGIGPEIVEATLRVLEAIQQRDDRLRFQWVPLPIGWEAIRKTGTATPESTVQALEKCDAWILGPHDSVSYPETEREKLNPSGELRRHFDLYANIRPARAYPGLPAMSPKMDLVVVRENTEGFYADRNMAWGIGEFMPTPDVALAVGKFTRHASERIARTAFTLARQRRRKVAIVHKANVLRKTYGLFLEAGRKVAAEFPEVAVEDYHIDAMAAHLVRRAADFDVILTTNMFGDILSDLTGELAGSLGMAPSINAGTGRAMAQASHGSAPDIAGKGIANPVGMILSAAMLLAWLSGQRQDAAAGEASQAIEQAVAATLAEGPRTRDLGRDGRHQRVHRKHPAASGGLTARAAGPPRHSVHSCRGRQGWNRESDWAQTFLKEGKKMKHCSGWKAGTISILFLGVLLSGILFTSHAMPADDEALRKLITDIHWLGHDSFRIDGDGVVIYIDPYKLKGGPKADLILITHDHSDHASPADVAMLQKPDTAIVTIRAAAAKLSGQIQTVGPGDELTVKGVGIKAVPAYNVNKFRSPGVPFHSREAGHVGYLVTVKGVRIYHAGDSDFVPEMKGLAPDVALLPVSGLYVMTAEEAVEAAAAINPKVAVPMHLGEGVGSLADAERFKTKATVPVFVLPIEK